MTYVTIVGGGITGLATAYYLQKNSRSGAGLPLDYTLLEGTSRLGGKVITETIGDGFIVEGGPDAFLTQKPWAMQLCRELGLADHFIPTNDDRRNIFVLDKGKLVPFPGGYRLTVPTEFIPFVLSPLISWPGKVRMALDLVLPPRSENGDESLASFVGRRLGREAVDKIAGPIMAGIYVGDPDRLSIQSTFPMFVELEKKYGSLIRAMRAVKKQVQAENPLPMFYSLKGGLQEMIETLRAKLESEVQLNRSVAEIRHLSSGFEVLLQSGDAFKTDAVVLTVPAFAAANIVRPLNRALADKLAAIRYVSTATISLGFKRAEVEAQHDLNGFGFVIPKAENRNIVACTWTSTKFDHRAPQDGVMVRAFVGGEPREDLVELADEPLIQLVREELAEIMGLTAKPLFGKVYRWPNGTPQYDVGHLDRVAEMEHLAGQTPGLYLAGSASRGVGLPDCIRSGQAVADRIGAAIGQSSHKEIVN
ncbi:MAG: protoporphyrinogen oxidase [Anaerolineae bacterium]|nr:protoporphyrinogen oxidase [Anaerolineae bacterium]